MENESSTRVLKTRAIGGLISIIKENLKKTASGRGFSVTNPIQVLALDKKLIGFASLSAEGDILMIHASLDYHTPERLLLQEGTKIFATIVFFASAGSMEPVQAQFVQLQMERPSEDCEPLQILEF